MDLVKLITDKVKEIETSGKLDEIVEKHATECINEVVSDSFRWNGEAKKAIEEGLKGKLQISLDELNVNRYHKIVCDIVEKQLNDTMGQNVIDNIKEIVDSKTEAIERKSYKLSEIIEKYIQSLDTSYDGEMDDQYGQCSLFIKESSCSTWVHFDKKEKDRLYLCDNKIGIMDGRIFYAEVDDKPFSPFTVRTLNGFDEFLFKLYCNNVEIIIDADNCELEYYREDCD